MTTTNSGDLIAEETHEQNQPLLLSLRYVYRANNEDNQSLARIRARLVAGEDSSQSRSSIAPVLPYRVPLTKSANASPDMFLEAGWRHRLNMVAAVLVATFLVASLLVLLNLGRHSSAGAGKQASIVQHVYQSMPTPLPFLTVPEGWTLLARLNGQGEQAVRYTFAPSDKWQALFTCQGSDKIHVKFVLSRAYPPLALSRYGLPAEISYAFSCAAPAGTQVFPAPTARGSVLTQVSAGNGTTWNMILIECNSNSTTCG